MFQDHLVYVFLRQTCLPEIVLKLFQNNATEQLHDAVHKFVNSDKSSFRFT